MRVFIVHWVARFMGVHFKIEGIPYGAPRHLKRGEDCP